MYGNFHYHRGGLCGKGTHDSLGKGTRDSPGKDTRDSPGKDTRDSPGKGTRDSPGKGTRDSPGKGTRDSPGKGTRDSPGKDTRDSPGKSTRDSPGKGTRDSPGKGTCDSPGKGTRDSPALSFLFVFLPPAESESPAPDEYERAQLGVWRQEKPCRSEREWDEVIQVVIESLPERLQPLPEGEYPVPPRKEHPMLPATEPQRESIASPECPALPPKKENPTLQLPSESSTPQLPSESVLRCPR
ncbi:hypothetical protein EOD39_10943 [Acipenser ruthenus]|uniref:Uncharacterized protein n=1 Tax=Acipenser ruthenus TaxID=7906 RepID=A0A662YUN8_ACIRT|nr:hypothetical protein EOD39_10943 [Acipenser ruthenus]